MDGSVSSNSANISITGSNVYQPTAALYTPGLSTYLSGESISSTNGNITLSGFVNDVIDSTLTSKNGVVTE